MNRSDANQAIIRNDILAALPLAELELLRAHIHHVTTADGPKWASRVLKDWWVHRRCSIPSLTPPIVLSHRFRAAHTE